MLFFTLAVLWNGPLTMWAAVIAFVLLLAEFSVRYLAWLFS